MNRGKKEEYNCRNCSDSFIARTADRERGWAQYCSKRCKQETQESKKKVWKTLAT